MRIATLTLAALTVAVFLACAGSDNTNPSPVAEEAPSEQTHPVVYRDDKPIDSVFAGPGLAYQVKVGRFGVILSDAFVAPVELSASGRKTATKERYFQALLAMGNNGRSPVKLSPWAVSGASLEDDLGHKYASYKPPSGRSVVTQHAGGDIAAGSGSADLLVFEKPNPKATALTLKLSAGNVGGEGNIVFVIEKNQLKHRSTPPD